MNDIVIDKLLWFMNLPEYQVYGFWSRGELEEKAYARWITSELLTAIMDHPTVEAMDTLSDMWFQILGCYYSAVSPRAKKQFLTALNTLDTINALL